MDRIVGEIVQRYPGEPRVALLRAQLLREAGKAWVAERIGGGAASAAGEMPR